MTSTAHKGKKRTGKGEREAPTFVPDVIEDKGVQVPQLKSLVHLENARLGREEKEVVEEDHGRRLLHLAPILGQDDDASIMENFPLGVFQIEGLVQLERGHELSDKGDVFRGLLVVIHLGHRRLDLDHGLRNRGGIRVVCGAVFHHLLEEEGIFGHALDGLDEKGVEGKLAELRA